MEFAIPPNTVLCSRTRWRAINAPGRATHPEPPEGFFLWASHRGRRSRAGRLRRRTLPAAVALAQHASRNSGRGDGTQHSSFTQRTRPAFAGPLAGARRTRGVAMFAINLIILTLELQNI